MNYKKGFTHILIILIVAVPLLLITLSYLIFANPNPINLLSLFSDCGYCGDMVKVEELDPIGGNYEYNSTEDTDWKTYRNEEYGFEFSYRPNLEVNEIDNGISFYHWPDNPHDRELFKQAYDGSITIMDKVEGLTLEEFVTKKLCVSTIPKDQQSSGALEFDIKRETGCVKLFSDTKNETEVASTKGLRGEFNYFENPSIMSLIEYKNKIYIFVVSGPETGTTPGEVEIQTYDQILSTFKFIKD